MREGNPVSLLGCWAGEDSKYPKSGGNDQGDKYYKLVNCDGTGWTMGHFLLVWAFDAFDVVGCLW